MNSGVQKTIICFNCKKDTDLHQGQKILRSEECVHCHASLRSCKMCEFYDKSAYNECRESQADRILEKEKANFCDYFSLKGSGNDGNNSKDALLDAASSLFKN